MKSVDDLLDLWEEQRELGRELTPEELCTDSPELLAAIRREIAAIKGFDKHFGPTSGLANAGNPSQLATPSQGSHADARQSLVSGTDLMVTAQYQILRLHGTGGLGEVYEALDIVLNRRVAIKIPKRNSLSHEHLHRFEREALITGGLDHPGIIPVHAFQSSENSRPFYVMRFADGITLRQAVEQYYQDAEAGGSSDHLRVRLRALIQAIRGVCGIVSYAHQRGVIHRDIKPSNIIVGQFGETILLDWGLARNLEELRESDGQEARSLEGSESDEQLAETPAGLTLPGRFIGTPGYASPEQNLGQLPLIDYRSDIYALGATLSFVLTGKNRGRSHWLADSPGDSDQRADPSLIRIRSFDPGLAAIVKKATAYDVNRRYSSVAELDRDLDRWLSGEAPSVYRGSLISRLARSIARHPKLTTVLATSVVLVFTFGQIANFVLQGKNSELAASNEKLRTAMTRAESASRTARGTLHLLIDDVVANDLLSKSELSESERAFFTTILQRFQELADSQEDSVESRRISAEGCFASARLLVRLSQSRDALPYLQRAAETYEALSKETGDRAIQLEHAAVCEVWSNTLIEQGELELADKIIRKGIQILNPTRQTSGSAAVAATVASADGPSRTPKDRRLLANLYSIEGYLRTLEDRWEESVVSFSAAKQILEELLEEEPSNLSWKLGLGRVYRSLGDACGELKEFDQQEDYARRSVELHRSLVDANDSLPDYRFGLIWSLYDSAVCKAAQDQHQAVIPEITEAIEVCEQLRQQFPLDEAYSGPQAILRSRRARSYEAQGEFSLAESDYIAAEAALRLVLTRNTRSAEIYPQLLTCLRRLSSLQRKLEKHELANETDRRIAETSDDFKADFPEFWKRSGEMRE